MSVGIPIKALHEAEGHIVTLETLTGEVYRGKLLIAEDNMNCQMAQVTVTHRDGRMTQLENVFVRGSKIRFFIFPDMIKNAPFFRQKDKSKVGIVGKSAFLKAQASKAQGRGIGKAKQYLERARQGR